MEPKFKLETLSSGAMKHLDSKLRMDLIPPEHYENLAKVLTYGANKYEDRNWEKGIEYMTNYASALRHLNQWAKGEDKDQESGLSHIDHAITNLMMISVQTSRDMTQLDNRPSKES